MYVFVPEMIFPVRITCWVRVMELTSLSTILQLYIVAVSFINIGGRNQSTQRKPLTCRKSLSNFFT